MKIEISIEKDGDGKDKPEGMDMPEEELTPEQIAEMAKKIKAGSLSRAQRTMLAKYLMSEAED